MQTPTKTTPDESDYTNLVTAVLGSACQPRNPRRPSKGGEGLEYFATPDGRWWLGLIDVDIERLIMLRKESGDVEG